MIYYSPFIGGITDTLCYACPDPDIEIIAPENRQDLAYFKIQMKLQDEMASILVWLVDTYIILANLMIYLKNVLANLISLVYLEYLWDFSWL